MDGDVISVERVISAAPEAIFALLTDPSKHPLIDGSGTVRSIKTVRSVETVPSEPLKLGSKFGMSMKAGIAYSMVSEVIEFDQDRRIAWQSRPPGLFGKFVGGRIWRYELEPVEGGTKVRESWDLSRDHQGALLKLGKLPARTRASMGKTLEQIEAITTA